MSHTCKQSSVTTPSIITVPVAVVARWRRKIAGLMADVNRHGLILEAVISNPAPADWMSPPGEPATLHGKPLIGDELARMPPPATTLAQKRKRGFESARVMAVSTPGSRKVWVTAASDDDLRAIVAASQFELIRRQVGVEKLAFNWGLEPPASAQVVRAGAMGSDHTPRPDKVKPYLLEDVYIGSCPVIGKTTAAPLDLSDLSI